ncbi:MAG: FKBP-type peptidyl-prolyl cis-trans isomerase [Gammaproteobacteria bacterium]|nr:FKBP-type peptidyl-prolyl cis-trans isomerase [Gammaproteobacteria bacterium]
MQTIEPKSRVTLHYRITLEDGTVADDTWVDDTPLTFAIGDGTMLPKLEESLIGLSKGSKEILQLSPEQAFGYPDSENVHQLELADFDMAPEPGQIIGFATPNGEEIPGMVIAVEEDKVTVNFNHPFAGHPLKFEIQVLEVTS